VSEVVVLTGFLAAAVRVATPLMLAALGETIGQRSGVINLGVEGAMLVGALAAAIGASIGGSTVGVVAAVLSGALVALVFAAVAIGARADQIITGTAITLGAVGVTGTVYRWYFGPGGAGLGIETLAPVPVPVLHRIPILGPALFTQPVLTYAAYLLVPLTWWLLFRTRWGLKLRAVGESREAAIVAGVNPLVVRSTATILSGALAGLAGASLVLAQVGTFTEQMTAGRGFVAIAIVVLGRWNPIGVAVAALLFGVANASQFLFQAMDLDIPYQFFLMLPYLLTLLALAGAVGRVTAPNQLGR
jgi:simple sugar transport system permease protein